MNNQEHLYQLTHALAEKWAEKGEAEIQSMIDEILQDRFKEFVLRVLGFETERTSNAPDHWRIDHCNGRSGNSPIGHFLNEKLVDKIAAIIDRIELTQEERNQLSKEARRVYLNKYSFELRQYAERKATEDAKNYAKRTIGEALNGAAESVRLRLMEANK